MRIEVKETTAAYGVRIVPVSEVDGVGKEDAVLLETFGPEGVRDEIYLGAEEALVLGLAISQVAVKGLDQRAICQVYERAMGRVMWAAMDGAEPLNEELGMVNSELLGNVVPFVGAGAGAPASQAGMPTPLACADSLEGPE